MVGMLLVLVVLSEFVVRFLVDMCKGMILDRLQVALVVFCIVFECHLIQIGDM